MRQQEHSQDLNLVRTGIRNKAWGRLPEGVLLSASGLLLVSLSCSASRLSLAWAPTAWFVGLALVLLPAITTLLGLRASRLESIGILVAVAICLYLVKVLSSPTMLTFHDELVHLRTATDIQRTHHLFTPNAIIPTSAFYPGLEITTSTLSASTNIPTFIAGTALVGLLRVVLVAGLYHLYRGLCGSHSIAAVATLVYMSNPSFLFFDGQFSYESLALPLAIFALGFALARKRDASGSVSHYVVLFCLVLAVVVSHHLTSYALALFACLWTVAHWAIRRSGACQSVEGFSPAALTAVTAGLAALWALVVRPSPSPSRYLGPYLRGALQEIWAVVRGLGGGRRLFETFSGAVTPVGEQVAGFSAVLLVMLLLLLGLPWVWRRRSDSRILALGVASLIYPLCQLFRLTYWGAEAANRSNGYIYVAVALVAAIGLVRLRHLCRSGWSRWVLVIGVLVIFAGNAIVGWPRWARMPGPYLVSADMRSIEPQGIQTALWMRDTAGPDNRISADRVNTLLMAALGEQRVVTGSLDGVLVAPAFLSEGFGPKEQAILRAAQVQYLVVDLRLATDLPMTEVYYERGEPNEYRHREPVKACALAKFDAVEGLSRIYHSGDLIIYRVTDASVTE